MHEHGRRLAVGRRPRRLQHQHQGPAAQHLGDARRTGARQASASGGLAQPDRPLLRPAAGGGRRNVRLRHRREGRSGDHGAAHRGCLPHPASGLRPLRQPDLAADFRAGPRRRYGGAGHRPAEPGGGPLFQAHAQAGRRRPDRRTRRRPRPAHPRGNRGNLRRTARQPSPWEGAGPSRHQRHPSWS